MDTRLLKAIFFCLVICILCVRTIKAQSTAASTCESTGHRCISPDQCSSLSLPDGQYQWCGGCQNHVRCLGGVGQLFAFNFQPYTQWDDNRKNYELTSTTCTECYYPCPPGPSAPTNPSGPLCDRTGLGCLTSSCPGGANGNFQYCVDCSNYVTCSISTGYSLVPCAIGTYYDDFSRTCLATSTTCRECYTNCSAPTTVPPSTLHTTEGTTEGTTKISTIEITTQGTTQELTTDRSSSQQTDGGNQGDGDSTTQPVDFNSSATIGAKAVSVTSSFFFVASIFTFLWAAL